MRKWGFLLIVLGGAIAVTFIFLPLYLPTNPLSKIMLQPLFCGSGETFLSETTYGVDFDGAETSSLNGYCVNAAGSRREITQQMVNIGLIGGGIPILIGVLLLFFHRFFMVFKQAMVMGQQQAQGSQNSPYNPTTMATRFSKPPNEQELREGAGMSDADAAAWLNQHAQRQTPQSLSDKLRALDDAYNARVITRDEYEAKRKQILDETIS